MRIATYHQPLSLFEQFNNELNTLFDRPPTTANFGTEEWASAVDIRETDDAFVIHADPPGVKAENIDVTLENGDLTLKSGRESSTEDNHDDHKRIERFSGTFMRRFTLPDQADTENVSAKTEEGVLELVTPKVEKAKQQKITAKSVSE